MTTTRRLPAVLILILLMLFFSQPSNAVHPGQNDTGQYTISVRVGLAVLPVTVTDHKTHRVAGLRKENFQIYEDGRPQSITFFEDKDAPVTVGLVVDNSRSMQPKLPAVIAAALAFAQSSNPHDEIFVVNFNHSVRIELPKDVPFTRSPQELRSALTKITASGGTALYDAIAVALEHLKHGSGGRKYLIVISDGGDNASRHKLADIVTMAQRSDASIYSIGILDELYADQNPGALKKLSKLTGGEFFLPESVPQVVEICKQIARDIRQQYTLGYLLTNHAEDGKYRSIKVVASAPGGGKLHVRTRAGYLGPVVAPRATRAEAEPSGAR